MFVVLTVSYAADLDECHAPNFNPGCDHYCENTDGGYQCSCKALYSLNNNGRTCDGATTFFSVAGSAGAIVIILLIVIIVLGVCAYRCRGKKTKGSKFTQEDTPNPL